MGAKYFIEGKQKSLDYGRVNFRINKKLPDVPDWWWPKPYEFEDYTIEARLGDGAKVYYWWQEGTIGGEGNDFTGDEKRENKDVKPGERKEIGSIPIEGY